MCLGLCLNVTLPVFDPKNVSRNDTCHQDIVLHVTLTDHKDRFTIIYVENGVIRQHVLMTFLLHGHLILELQVSLSHPPRV